MDFWDFLDFSIFGDFLGFFVGFFGFLSKLLRLLLKVTEVTTKHQKLPKISKNCLKSFFLPEGQSPPQELEESLRSGLYLLVCLKIYLISPNIICMLPEFHICANKWKIVDTNNFALNTRNFAAHIGNFAPHLASCGAARTGDSLNQLTESRRTIITQTKVKTLHRTDCEDTWVLCFLCHIKNSLW